MTPSDSANGTPTVPEDQLRAGTYSLLAALLRAPLSGELQQRLLGIDAHDPAAEGIAGAWAELREAAGTADPAAVEDEFHTLFIGIGRGELVPYGSWYRTGFLMEKPLGELRRELTALGFERQAMVREPEDHAAALCEVMAILITDGAAFEVQQRFFNGHIGPWIQAFCADLGKAPSARFYRAVGRLGQAFFRLEARYLSMPI